MKVEPIRERRDIATIRKLLKDEPSIDESEVRDLFMAEI